MKILCIADIHGDKEAARKAREYALYNDIEMILVLGDFPGHGVFTNIALSLNDVKEILENLSGVELRAIPGNCDLMNITELFEERGINIHEKSEEFGDYVIAGFGGSNETPFDTPFELSEDEIYSRLKTLLGGIAEGKKTILALHCPPKDTKCDETSSGMHVGSIAVRRIIEEFQPCLALCSHIHEAGGSRDAIGSTTLTNIGRLSEGRAGIIDLETGEIEQLVIDI